MELWYFTPFIPSWELWEDASVAALTQRLAGQYGADFHITVFLPEAGNASSAAPTAFEGKACMQVPPAPAEAAAAGERPCCKSNGCTLRTFPTGTDPYLAHALGDALRLSYEMHLAARAVMQKEGKPDAVLFPLAAAAPYYTLLYRYLDSAFWADCPVFVEDFAEEDGACDARPEYLLPGWWIAQQQRFCRMAASGVVSIGARRPESTAGALAPTGLAGAVRAARAAAFAPAEFPFLTVRPQTPAPAVKSEPGMLTVIIPHYNLGQTLPETLESAFASDHPNYEVLLLDDGSTDAESVRMLRQMEEKYPLLRIVRQENAGLSAVRNRGAALARGEYITFLDADDCVAPDFYRRGAALLDQYKNAAYVSSWLRLFGDVQGYKAYFPSCLPALLLDNMQGPGCVIRRNIFLAFGQNCVGMRAGFEDHESWLRMAEHGWFGINIPEPLFYYRLSGGSMSAAFSRDESHERHIRLYQELEAKHPSLYREYSTELYNLLTANGPGYLWAGPALSHAPVGYLNHSESFWRHELALARADADNYKNSRAYRLGELLLHPMRSLRKNK